MPDADSAVLDAAEAAAGDEAAASEDSDTSSDHLAVSYWLSDAARARLESAGGFNVVDDAEQAAQASLVLVSTRIPAGASPNHVRDLATRVTCPIVAVVHPGGEEVAVALLAAGASGIVAEGNEEAVVAFVGTEPPEAGLLDSFEQSLDRREDGNGRATGDRDPVTRLRGPAALASRLGGAPGSPVPRLAFARVVGFDDSTRRLSAEARDLLKRRMALQFDELCRHWGADIFSTGPGEFALVSEDLAMSDFEMLGKELIDSTAGFSPDRTNQLLLAVGHAGPEATSATETLRELALRGMELAAEYPEQGIVGAERLALSLASTTELNAAMRAISEVEERDAYPPSHGERVARYAVTLAESLGITDRSLLRIRLAARLHDVGKLTLDAEAASGTDESLDGETLAEYQTHPTRGADMLRAAAGLDVAEAVEAHHERWDGSGYPNGLAGDAIPMASRIIAVANALDRWSVNGAAPDRPTPEAVQKVVDAAETWFDPTVAEACASIFGAGA